jgi:hypothetical protein
VHHDRRSRLRAKRLGNDRGGAVSTRRRRARPEHEPAREHEHDEQRTRSHERATTRDVDLRHVAKIGDRSVTPV